MLGFCPGCNGLPFRGRLDCGMCKGAGDVKITRCPKMEVEPGMWEFVRLADWAKDGSFPAAGGTMDQSASFMDACRYLWARESEIEAETRKAK